MRGSHEKTTPRALADWLAEASPSWSPSYPFPRCVREPVVDALLKAQRGLCVYCGRSLDLSKPGKSYHIEHFRPRGSYPGLATCFANLFLSCGHETDEGNPSQICGTAKGGWFDEGAHVEPDYPDCANRFRFSLTGEVAPETARDAAARQMIDRLNLNHRELKRDRKDILYRIDGEELGLSDFFDPAGKGARSYAHVVCRHVGEEIP